MPKTLKLIFVSLSIYSFSTALISVFVPIFLIQHGFSLTRIIFIFVTYALSKLAVNYLVVRAIVKRGSRYGLSASYVTSVLALVLLNIGLIKLSYPLLLTSFIIAAWSDAFQWNAQHLHLSSLLDKNRKSHHIAFLSNIGTVLGIVAPLLGGVLAGYFGSTLVLVIASVLGVAAMVPLYWKNFEKMDTNEKEVPYDLKSAPLKDLVANAAWNTETAIAMYIWPMYVFLFIGKLQNIGLLVAVGSFLTFLVVYFAGKRGDKTNAKKVVNEGSVSSSIFHLVRAFAQTTGWVIVGDLGYKVTQKYMEIGWVSTYYGHAKGKGLAYINSMEIAGDIARLVVWLVLLLVTLSVSSSSFYRITFVLAAVITLFCTLVSREKKVLAQ